MSMPSGPGPVVQRAILTSELQRLRQEHGSTQDQAASALDWSLSKLIRIEGGSVGVSTTDLHALLRYYGMPDGDPAIGRLTELARDGRQRGWWALYRNEISPAYTEFIGYEAGASTIRCLQPLAIPGLLQIEEYANALTIEFARTREQRDIIVEVRMQRQDQVLGRADPPLLHVVLDEAALRRHVGGQTDRGIMTRQLRHLVEMSAEPNIIIELIPFTQGAHFGMQGEFTILGFADSRLGDVLFIENARSSDTNVADRDTRITEYRVAFENLRRLTLPEDETVPFLEAVIADIGA
ncbi:helix-turn-helix protein [Actinocorallia herbida]|uniref:Helix-turn-helix protein n=1 Tax=Actinocorallia herbida TaxID=58109 RepID=A0A3N1CQJ5_9ACTN|nr:helix-turn-helix transcriptional regulator [Actinocorallia herbida]ROO83008.1 helix-turn-helix protein [Actinocorallia herbida]